MAVTTLGPTRWTREDDKDGNRDYSITFRVETTDEDDGPQTILAASGLPAVGDSWTYGNDNDKWALRTPEASVTQTLEDEPNFHWLATFKFTTRADQQRCRKKSLDNPLAEPDKISGTFVQAQKKFIWDRFGNGIRTTSFELTSVEDRVSLPTVRIEQNVLNLGLNVFAPMVNTVNEGALWDVPARGILFSNTTWEQKFWGECNPYFTRVFDFEVDYSTFDRSDIPNKGRKLIHGAWNAAGAYVPVTINGQQPSPDRPDHYITAVDRYGNPTETFIENIGLRRGCPSEVERYLPTVQLRPESDFLVLGIPTRLTAQRF